MKTLTLRSEISLEGNHVPIWKPIDDLDKNVSGGLKKYLHGFSYLASAQL